MVHFHVAVAEEGVAECFSGHPRVDKDECRSFPLQDPGKHFGLVPEIIPDKPDRDLQLLCHGYLHDGTRAGAAKEPGNIFRVPDCGRETYPLEFPGIDTEAFKTDRELGTPFTGGE